MDRKSIIVLLVCLLLLFTWSSIINRMFPPIPVPEGTNIVSTATNVTAPAPETNISDPQTSAAPVISATQPTPVEPDAPEQLVTIENEDARFTFTSYGGGLKRIELKEHPATVVCDKRQVAETNRATLNAPAPVAAFALLANTLDQRGFQITNTGPLTVQAEKVQTNGLRIIKSFQLSTNYLVKVNIRLENASTGAIHLPAQELVIGSSTPIGKRDETWMMGLQWYDSDSAVTVDDTWFQNRPMGCGMFPERTRNEYAAGSSNVFWGAAHNQFFAMIAVPDQPAPRFIGRRIHLPIPTQEQLAADPSIFARPIGFQAGFGYLALSLRPGEVVERKYDLYAGPKEYNTLARLGNKLDLAMKFGFFGWFAKALLLSMNGLNKLGLSYGLAIVVITIIIKLIFWPLTNASTKSMKRMAALQPQMKAIQEKYKDDPKKMNMKLMEFMKENRVSPLGGCLPMLLQIPVFIGFYTMLQSAIELRGARFLWACDLSQADTVWVVPGLNFPVNPMPLIMGLTMLWQARLTPPSPGMDPVQQKIMKYMPLIFMVFLYTFSAGLTLYWTVQNLLTIAQMKLTKSTGTPKSSAPGSVPPHRPGGPPKKKH